MLLAKYTGISEGIGCLKKRLNNTSYWQNRPADRAQTWSNTISHAHRGSCWKTEARTRTYYWESLRSDRMGVQNCYPTQTQESKWNTTLRWNARRESCHLDDETHQPNYRWALSRPQWRDCFQQVRLKIRVPPARASSVMQIHHYILHALGIVAVYKRLSFGINSAAEIFQHTI